MCVPGRVVCLMLLFLLFVPYVLRRAAPSPRQRCRIRTNPWVSIAADGVGGCNNTAAMTAAPKIMDCETGSTSSGVKSGIEEKNWPPNGYLFISFVLLLPYGDDD